MSKTTTIASVLVLLILIVAGGAYYYFHTKKAAPVVPPPVPVATTANYASSTMGVSLVYPIGYMVNEEYTYDQFGPKKLINGVSFTIPQTMATGTNLSSDTRLSVEQLPHAKNCTADIFLSANVKAQTVTDGSMSYSVASSSDAGAGNRYEELVYALPASKPCTAVRYFVHYSAIENYPPGMVQPFDQAALVSSFDTIRHSLVLGQ